MNRIDDPSQSQPDDPASFRESKIDALFEEVVDGVAAAKEATKAPSESVEVTKEPETPEPPEPPAKHPEPIVLTEETEEVASDALDAALSAPPSAEATEHQEPAGEPIAAEEARALIERLTTMEAQLRKREVSREEASRILQVGSEALERFPKDDSTFEILKDEFLDAYFALDRTIRPTLEVPVKPEYEPQRRPATKDKATQKRRKRPTVTRDLSAVAPQKRGRMIAMIVIMVLLGGGRIAYYFTIEQAANKSKPEVTREAFKDVQGSRVSLDKAGKQSNDFNQGIPVMTYLQVLRLNNGGFGANAAAIDLDSNKLKYNYKWYKNGQLIKVEHEGRLDAGQVEELATYKVVATATDGKLTSAPMQSAPIVVKPKPKNGT